MILAVLVLGPWSGLTEAATRWTKDPPIPVSRRLMSGDQEAAAECDLKKIADVWECRKCGFIERVDREGRCACRQKAEKTRACEKVYYVAECCKTRHAAKGKCCGADYVEKTSRARLEWACKGCGAEGKEGDSCSRKGCRLGGKPLATVCGNSGQFPHGGQP